MLAKKAVALFGLATLSLVAAGGNLAVAATACTGAVLNSDISTFAIFNSVSNSCVVVSGANAADIQIQNTTSGFYSVVNAIADSYAATAVLNGQFNKPGVTAVDVNGAPGVPLENFFRLSNSFSGPVTMKTFATLAGVEYLMTTNWRAVAGSTIDYIDGEVSVAVVPIPAALPLFATGVAAVAYAGRRKRKAAQAA
jgi:hypothetical protein